MAILDTKEKSAGFRKVSPLTTYEISRYLHVDLTTVINWCDQGKIKAYKTPGGHRRVGTESFLEFLKQYQMPVSPEFEERMKGTLKILIVDDEQDVRQVIRRSLNKKLPQAKVFEAQDGFEAGKMVLDAMPHLVVLDLKLPGIDGFRVCANIKNDERFKETKILAITGQNTTQNRKMILDAGADDFLAKPFDIKEFMEKVFEILELPKEKLND